MCSANKMQSNFVWIITLLANSVIVTSSNVERPKRDLVFLKTIMANIIGYNKNNVIMKNENNIKILYPVPNYQLLMNIMPDPYMKQNIYTEAFPKILIPSNVVMQPITHFRRRYVPYITKLNGRNFKAPYTIFLPVYGNMQRVIPLPHYNSVGVPSVRCNDKIPVSHKKSVIKDTTGKMSRTFGKQFPNFRDTEEINKEVDVQRVQTVEPLHPMVILHEEKDEEINPTSTISAHCMLPNNTDATNNNFNPHNHSTNIEIITSNNPNKGTVFKIENVNHQKDIENLGDLMAQPSDVISGITPIKEKEKSEEKPQNNISLKSDAMEVNNRSTEVYPSDIEKFDYLNRSPVVLDKPSYVPPVQEEVSQNKSNERDMGGRWFMRSASEREISRGDIPDL